jgi:hypothetical protein
MRLINYESINDRLDITDVAELYGVSVNNKNKSLCPFHSEKTASLAYRDNKFTCFGCGAHGDIVDFVSKLFGLSNVDAVKRLNADYKLGLDYTAPPDNTAILKRQRQKRLEKQFRAWEIEAFKTICDYVKLLRQWRIEHKPVEPNQQLDEHFVQSLQNLSYAEYILNVFTFNPMADRLEFYSSAANRKWVTEIERTVRRYRELTG